VHEIVIKKIPGKRAFGIEMSKHDSTYRMINIYKIVLGFISAVEQGNVAEVKKILDATDVDLNR